MSADRKGWLCPACNGGVAPGVERCPCVPQQAKTVGEQIEEALRKGGPVIGPLPCVPHTPHWYPRWPGDVPPNGERWDITRGETTDRVVPMRRPSAVIDHFTVIGDA